MNSYHEYNEQPHNGEMKVKIETTALETKSMECIRGGYFHLEVW